MSTSSSFVLKGFTQALAALQITGRQPVQNWSGAKLEVLRTNGIPQRLGGLLSPPGSTDCSCWSSQLAAIILRGEAFRSQRDAGTGCRAEFKAGLQMLLENDLPAQTGRGGQQDVSLGSEEFVPPAPRLP